MTRCRSTSFYVAPGEHRSFSSHSAFARLADGTFRKIVHRRDVGVLEDGGNWDGILFVAHGQLSVAEFEALQFPRVDEVQLWQVDRRVIEGRRPSGARYVIHKVASRGVEGMGGGRQVLDDCMPRLGLGAKAALAQRLDACGSPSVQSQLLTLVVDASPVLDDATMQSFAASLDGWMPDVTLTRVGGTVADLRFLERYGLERRRRLVSDLWRSSITAELSSWYRIAEELSRTNPKQAGRAVADMWAGAPAAATAGLHRYADSYIDASTLPLPAALIEAAATSRDVREALSFHPDAPLPLIRDALVGPDSRRLLHDLVVSVPNSSARLLRPDQAAMTVELLQSMPLGQTHSSTRAENLFNLSAACLAAGDGGADAVTVRTWSTWLRASSARNHVDLEQLGVLANSGAQLNAVQLADMWRAAIEWERRNAEQASAKGTAVSHVGVELVEFLQTQDSCPPSVREQVEARWGTMLRSRRPLRAGWVRSHKMPALLAQLDGDELVAALSAEIDDIHRHDDETTKSPRLARIAEAAICHPSLSDEAAASTITRILEVLTPSAGAQVPAVAGRPPHETQRARAELHAQLNLQAVAATQVAALGRVVRGSGPIDDADAAVLRKLARNWELDLGQLIASVRDDARRDVVATLVWEEVSDGDYRTIAALMGSTLPPLTNRSQLVSTSRPPAVGDLAPDVLWPERPKRWSDLPDIGHRPWQIADELGRVAGAAAVTVGDELLDAHVFENMQELKVNANQMGNCTASYGSDIADGSCVIVALREPGTRRPKFNVALDRGQDGRWAVGEIKGPGNRVPSAQEAAAITTQILGRLPARLRPKSSPTPA